MRGFSLIELLVIIVVVGVLAAMALRPLSELPGESRRAVVSRTGAAFRGGVLLVHEKWLAAGAPGAILDLVPITSNRGSGALSVNIHGWPADMRDTSLTLNGSDDCEDVWNAVLGRHSPSVSKHAGVADYHSTYLANSCVYELESDTLLSIAFDSNSGNVVISD